VVGLSRFARKTAIVTGGASGIGFAVAERLLSEGANVVIADLAGALDAPPVVAWASAQDRVRLARCDITLDSDIESVCAEAVAAFGGLDVLVNNAGGMIYKSVDSLTRADWLDLLNLNLVGAAMFTKAAFARMPKGGAIVNVASVHAYQTSPYVAPYASAKAGLVSLTRTASIEGRERGFRVNAVLPGAIDTPMLRASPNIKSGAEKLDPADVGEPSQVAACVAFLASDEASFITGAAFTVDGGRLARL
jgi:NAD(P)-dependent dehydrogenase (short-subunit alcohol dehydrogenase family)